MKKYQVSAMLLLCSLVYIPFSIRCMESINDNLKQLSLLLQQLDQEIKEISLPVCTTPSPLEQDIEDFKKNGPNWPPEKIEEELEKIEEIKKEPEVEICLPPKELSEFEKALRKKAEELKKRKKEQESEMSCDEITKKIRSIMEEFEKNGGGWDLAKLQSIRKELNSYVKQCPEEIKTIEKTESYANFDKFYKEFQKKVYKELEAMLMQESKTKPESYTLEQANSLLKDIEDYSTLMTVLKIKRASNYGKIQRVLALQQGLQRRKAELEKNLEKKPKQDPVLKAKIDKVQERYSINPDQFIEQEAMLAIQKANDEFGNVITGMEKQEENEESVKNLLAAHALEKNKNEFTIKNDVLMSLLADIKRYKDETKSLDQPVLKFAKELLVKLFGQLNNEVTIATDNYPGILPYPPTEINPENVRKNMDYEYGLIKEALARIAQYKKYSKDFEEPINPDIAIPDIKTIEDSFEGKLVNILGQLILAYKDAIPNVLSAVNNLLSKIAEYESLIKIPNAEIETFKGTLTNVRDDLIKNNTLNPIKEKIEDIVDKKYETVDRRTGKIFYKFDTLSDIEVDDLITNILAYEDLLKLPGNLNAVQQEFLNKIKSIKFYLKYYKQIEVK